MLAPSAATLALIALNQIFRFAGAYRVLFEFLAYTWLRISDGLGLRRCDVDFEAGVLHVRQQLSRHRTPKHLKTDVPGARSCSPRP